MAGGQIVQQKRLTTKNITEMKKFTLTITGILLAIMTVVAAGDEDPVSKDTIEIRFGDKGIIIIKVDKKEDLDALKSYDINSIIDDIELPDADTLKGEEVIIKEEDGTKYLRDEDEEFRKLEEEFGVQEGDSDDDSGSVSAESSAGKSTGIGYHEERRRKRYRGAGTEFISGIDIGINNYLENGEYPDKNNAQYTVKGWGSWYIALQPTWQTHIAGPLAIDYGAGISWYNFKFQDPYTRLVKGENGAVFTRWDASMNATKSKLTVFHINAHFVPVLDFSYKNRVRVYDDGFRQKRAYFHRNSFRIGLGGYIGTRLDSYTKLVWRVDGKKSKKREKSDYFLGRLRYGIRGIIGWGEMDIFVNYDMSNLFYEDRGPRLNPLTFGVSF